MPLNETNTRVFHRTLYAGMLKKVTLLKRGIDQLEGTVTAYTIFEARRSSIHKSGEPIQDDSSSNFRTRWHIPRVVLDALGISDINAADRVIENPDSPYPSPQAQQTRWWQPEANTFITVKLFENMVVFDALRIDPPLPNTPPGR